MRLLMLLRFGADRDRCQAPSLSLQPTFFFSFIFSGVYLLFVVNRTREDAGAAGSC